MTILHFMKLFGAALIYMVVNVAFSILWVAVYAYLINPGHPHEFYQEYAKWSSPYSSIIFGMPLMFAMCWWLSGGWMTDFTVTSALIVWVIYSIIDVIVVSASGMTSRLMIFVFISLLTKLIAAVLGARIGSQSIGL